MTEFLSEQEEHTISNNLDMDQFDYMQVNEIKKGLDIGLDVAIYAKKEFDWFQMAEIREGMMCGIDVSIYATQEYDYLTMREIKLSLIDKIDIMDYARMGFKGSILKQLRMARTDHVDIESYIKEKYDGDQLEEIRQALLMGVDPTGYISNAFFGSQIKEICLGLQSQIDVSVYSTGEYNWFQMREIRLGMEEHLDVTCYTRPLLDYRQMKEIRLGLEAGVNAKEYAKIAYTPEMMSKAREKMLEDIALVVQKKEEEKLLLASQAKAEEKSENEEQVSMELAYVTRYIQLRCSNNGLSASLSCIAVDEQHPYFNEHAIIQFLKNNKVVQGVDKDAIHKFAAAPEPGKELVVAKGKKAVDGKNGYYTFYFKTDMPTLPKQFADGSVDYLNMDLFEEVHLGQKLAEYEPATDGNYGYNIYGQLLKPQKGIELSILRGKGFQISENRREYFAALDGKAELDGDMLYVTKLYVVDGNCDVSIGNIHFDGDVCVKGDVIGNLKIIASGNVKIVGHVENAYIESGKDCIIGKGMQGAGSGKVKSKGNVYGNFFEYTIIETNMDIHANYLLNCDAFAEGKIVLMGLKGSIIGGVSQAVKGIESYNLGNLAQIRTELNVGITKKIEESYQQVTAKAKTIMEEINTFQNGKRMFENRLNSNELSLHETYGKILQAIEMKETEYRNCLQDEKHLIELMTAGKDAKIQCYGPANAGLFVTISNHDLYLTKQVVKAYFCLNEDHVAIFKL